MNKMTDKEEPLTEETIIGSRKCAAAEFRKFFRETLGEEYEKHAVVMDVLNKSFYFKGRTLQEILDECLHPSWYQKMDESITSFPVQKETKVKIEDVIPHYLGGDMRKDALDFAAYMQTDKMLLKWDAWNTWKASCKSKVLCWVKLNLFVRPIAWEVSPCLTNIDKYEESVRGEGLQDFVRDNFKRCRPSCLGRGRCQGARSVTILGKEFNDICREVLDVNGKKVDYVNPDETAVNRIKKLLDFERRAREKESMA